MTAGCGLEHRDFVDEVNEAGTASEVGAGAHAPTEDAGPGAGGSPGNESWSTLEPDDADLPEAGAATSPQGGQGGSETEQGGSDTVQAGAGEGGASGEADTANGGTPQDDDLQETAGAAPEAPGQDCSNYSGTELDIEGCTVFYLDADGDGYGDDRSDPVCSCSPFDLYLVSEAGDCDDGDESIHGGAAESCNGIDDDCDGDTDELWPTLNESCDGTDSDACEDGVVLCNEAGDGVVCNDGMTTANGTEVCDGADNDCDGRADEDWTELGESCDGADADQCADGVWVCNAGGTGVTCSDDTFSSAERCDGVDNDCDGSIDEDWSEVGQPCDGSDADQCADGYWECNSAGTNVTCSDSSASTAELCDGEDNDCDGNIDEDWPNLGDACDGSGDADSCEDGVFRCDGTGSFCDDAFASPNALATCEPLRSVSTSHGANTGTYDPNTGLTWLDPTLSTGMTYAQAVSARGSGGQFSGYRLGTRAELETFFGNAGIQLGSGFSAENFAPVTGLMSLVGITAVARGNRDDEHFFDFTSGWIVPLDTTGNAWQGSIAADPYHFLDGRTSFGWTTAESYASDWGAWYVQ